MIATMKHRKIIKTEAQVIKALGGTTKCAVRFDRTPGCISQWRNDGIPTGYHCRIEHTLEAEGYIVDVAKLGWI